MKIGRALVGILIILLSTFTARWVLYNVMYPYEYKEFVDKHSKEYNLDPLFVLAVIKAESNFDSDAKSYKDAHGLMQLTDDTARWASKEMQIEQYDVSMLMDPEFNISMGCWYIDNLYKEFNNLDLVLAAYNGGRGNVNKWLNDYQYSKDGKMLDYIPFKETDKYVKRVKVNYNIYKFLYR